MKRIVFALLIWAVAGSASAAGPNGGLMSVDIDPTDRPSLQRGAQLFANYCMACHEAQFMRYGRVAADLGLSEELTQKYLMFTDAQIGDTMLNAMDPTLAEEWFGITPPDLSLIARVRGSDWVYTFLNSFYRDDNAPLGVNNLVVEDLSMPHVLWPLQGLPEPRYEVVEVDGVAQQVMVGINTAEANGALSESEYRAATRDLVNFLAYVGEPIRADRERLGIGVLLFLAVFLLLAYLLKKEYWRDVH